MMKVVNSLHDMLDSVHKDSGSERGLLKADLLQRAPVRSSILPRGCARGDGNENPYSLAILKWAVGHNEPHIPTACRLPLGWSFLSAGSLSD